MTTRTGSYVMRKTIGYAASAATAMALTSWMAETSYFSSTRPMRLMTSASRTASASHQARNWSASL